MFFHHSDLAYKVRVDNPNPMYARLLQQAIGGPEGELRVMSQYLFQGFNARGPARYRDMLLSTGNEEIGHVEVLATAVAMNLEGAKSELVDEVATNPLIAVRMGGIEPRHFLSTGGGATPADAKRRSVHRRLCRHRRQPACRHARERRRRGDRPHAGDACTRRPTTRA